MLNSSWKQEPYPSIYSDCGQAFHRHGLASKTCSAAKLGEKAFYSLPPIENKKVHTLIHYDAFVCNEESSIFISSEFFGQCFTQRHLI